MSIDNCKGVLLKILIRKYFLKDIFIKEFYWYYNMKIIK